MKKYDLFWVDLNPVKGSEQAGIRPCVILQNNLANQSKLQTVCIAPLTTSIRKTPTGVFIFPSDKNNLSEKSRIELSQMRAIDKQRLLDKIGKVDQSYCQELNKKICDFFDISDIFQ